MLPTTVDRVSLHTAPRVNERIRQQTERNIGEYQQSSASRLSQRLEELDQEWDIERTLEANAAIVCLAGVGLGTVVDRRWFALPAVVGGFLLQHALQGWCPPLPVFRRLGFRTAAEIDYERDALRAELDARD